MYLCVWYECKCGFMFGLVCIYIIIIVRVWEIRIKVQGLDWWIDYDAFVCVYIDFNLFSICCIVHLCNFIGIDRVRPCVAQIIIWHVISCMVGCTLNSAYNEVAFNEKSAITKENLCTKYFHSPIMTLPLTKSHLLMKENLHIFFSL